MADRFRGEDNPGSSPASAVGTVALDPDTAAGMTALVVAVRAAAARRARRETPEMATIETVLGQWSDAAAAGHAARIGQSLRRLAAVFRLDEPAARLLIAAAAPDIDPAFAAAYGLLLGAGEPRPATIALALELAGLSMVDPAGRAALGPMSPLRCWGLVTITPGPWGLGRTVSAGEDVISALLGAAVPEPVFATMTIAGADDPYLDDGVAEIARALNAGHRLCWVEDPPGSAGAALAAAAFEKADIRCTTVDLASRPANVSLADTAVAIIRGAGLAASGLVITAAEQLAADPDAAAAVRLLADAPIPIVMVGACRWNASWHRQLPIIIRSAPLAPAQRLTLWRRHIAADQVADSVLTAYRLAPEQIDAAARHALAQAEVFDRTPDPVAVTEAVRILGGSTRLKAGLGWARTGFDDLEVPADARAALERLASWVRLRDSIAARGAVHGMGGKGAGIAALFTGSPGTGKTLAAHVIADTAGLDLLQVDLSGVIDKYIGETEKNLERVFVEAESLNVVLFFDEADALFGRRSDVSDAHDRFANQEVAYLLQRMEQFDGITVLATNLKGNLDPAFARRMHFIVHFPDPDEPTRARLWAKLLAQAGPRDPADPIDIPALAAVVELAGGDLRNIVLAAVYDAAIAGGELGMRHIVAAAVREHGKLGRRVPQALEQLAHQQGPS